MTLIDEHDLDLFVKEQLPSYYVPEKWTYITTVPLTPEGKVDKEKLTTLAVRTSRRPTLPARPSSLFTSKDLYRPAKVNNTFSQTPENPAQENRHSTVLISSHLSVFNVSKTSLPEAPVVLPARNDIRGLRWLRHRAFKLSRRILSCVIR
jgi:hypothetical protein